jgi:hypothetical protein
MKRALGAGTIAIACVLAGSTALAAGSAKCAKPEEMTAMQTAAVQQELMVAALSCHAITLYNAFVIGYQKELQASDKSLQRLFQRLHGGKKGTEDYHAYKTKLANGSSIKSIQNITQFCADAQAAFATALSPAKESLSNFVSGRAKADNEDVTPCEYQENTMAAMKAVPHIVLKKPPVKKKSAKAADAEHAAPAQGSTAASGTP